MHLTFYPLITTKVVFNLFHWLINMIKLQLLEIKCVFENQYLQMVGLKLNKCEQF